LALDPSIAPCGYIAPFVSDPDAVTFEERVDGIGRTCIYAIQKLG
jgi:hypothetical protein